MADRRFCMLSHQIEAIINVNARLWRMLIHVWKDFQRTPTSQYTVRYPRACIYCSAQSFEVVEEGLEAQLPLLLHVGRMTPRV